jgi:YggT family protein
LLYNLFSLVINVVAGLFAGVLLLRFWMQVVRVRPPQQIAQFTFHLTDWLVKPLRRAIPGVGGLDWASMLGAYIVAFLCTALKMGLLLHTVLGSIFLLALLSLLQWMVYGWTALLILEVVFSWVNPHAPLAPFVQMLNAPLLRPIRRVVPLLGGLDLSPLVLFLLLQVASTVLVYASAMLGA